MDRAKIKDMLMEILNEVDYDIAKQYDPKTAEEPELVEKQMNKLVKIVKKYFRSNENRYI